MLHFLPIRLTELSLTDMVGGDMMVATLVRVLLSLPDIKIFDIEAVNLTSALLDVLAGMPVWRCSDWTSGYNGGSFGRRKRARSH